MRFGYGTPPRAKTIRAIERQTALGLPRNSKLSITQSAQLAHPTKGLRVRREGIAVPLRGSSHQEDLEATRGLCRKLLGMLKAFVDKRRAAEFEQKRRARRAVVESLTNWERSQWARTGYSEDPKLFVGTAARREVF